MWYLDKRVQVICDELKKLITVKTMKFDKIRYKEGLFFYPREAQENGGEWREFYPEKMKWYGPDRHYWFQAEYTVPGELAGQALRLCVKTQIEEWDDGKNPQFLLFVNGEATQGLDMNHRLVHMTEVAAAGEKWRFDLQAYTGTLHAEFDLILEMQQADLRIEKLYYDLVVPLRAFSRMEKDDRNRMELERVLNEAVNLLDLRTPYSEDFYQSIRAAEQYLEKTVYGDMAGCADVVATCIGHTHIDVAWWWTVAQTREKVARSFATVLKLMEEYPQYRFMSSQPQLYQFLKERYPDMYERIKARIREERWEPEGGMWLEADTNLTSGESLVRQLFYGKKFFREEFGTDSRILWLPDVFGYSGALPQIMKKSGIDYFMTTKLAWNQIDKMPYDTFMWKGIDGSTVFTHLITTLGVGQSEEDFFTTYNGMLHPDAIMGGWHRYQNKDINNDILVAFGYGDGGGGPTREMLETAKRMEKGICGIPKVRQEFSRVYFDELYERVKDSRRLPVWEGELYFEYHRGTYTSMGRNKRANRKSEILMMDVELLCTLAALRGMQTPAEELERMWKVILLNQFHDILPGSSIREVYEVTKQEYGQLARKGGELLSERMHLFAGEGDCVTLFNTTGFTRNDIVRLPEGICGALVDADGTRYPVQSLGAEAVVYAAGLPAKGWKSFYIDRENGKPDVARSVPFVQEGNMLETPYYRILFDDDGMFSSIYDKKNRREILKPGRPGNRFCMYEDKPMNYDNWDIDIYYTEKSWDVPAPVRMEWTACGPVCAVLEQERRISNSRICQKIYFYADTPRIDFETWVDWREHQHLLKVHFPVDVHTDEASFDIQFGNLTRKVHTNTSWDMARFESCGQKWIDLSEGHYGVSLLNDCKYGHSVRDGEIGLTLIKSGIEPNPAADQEEHVFTYALYPHSGSLRECDTVREGYCLNFPVHTHADSAFQPEASFLSCDSKNVMLETVKEADDGNGIIIRMYEYENARTQATVSFGMGYEIGQVQECDLMEETQGGDIVPEGGSFRFEIRPYEIKSYRVVLK